MSGADDPAALLGLAAEALARGVGDRHHGFHTPVLAGLGADGRPRARVVVLRGARTGEGGWSLRVHADARSAKVPEFAADPRAALCFYDAPGALQLRVEGRVTVHRGDEVARGAFAEARDASLRTYGVAPPSGAPLAAARDYALPPAEEARAQGWPNFAALVLDAAGAEVLHLAAAGHRRARFTFGAGASATWLVP